MWFGVGTGDVKNALSTVYETKKIKLDEEYQKRAHNQFITFLLTFGILGFFIITISIYYPVCNATNQKISFVFIFMMSLSFLTEDTLETQAGVTLFAIFYSLLNFGLDNFQPRISK